MKTNDEFNDAKRRAIDEQLVNIKRCLYMIKRTCKYPDPKNVSTHISRGLRILSYAMSIKSSIIHLNKIISQPKDLTLFDSNE